MTDTEATLIDRTGKSIGLKSISPIEGISSCSTNRRSRDKWLIKTLGINNLLLARAQRYCLVAACPRRSSGPDVTAIQNRLAELGYGVKADGRFGAKTKQALMQFQRDSKLTPDGVVGGKTWAVLMAGPARRASLSTTSSA